MGTGTDIAMESANVTLVKGDLRGIVHPVASAAMSFSSVSLIANALCLRHVAL